MANHNISKLLFLILKDILNEWHSMFVYCPLCSLNEGL